MTFDDWLKQYKYKMVVPRGAKDHMRFAYIAGQQDIIDTMDLPAITTPAKVAYVLCDNCEQYHEPSDTCPDTVAEVGAFSGTVELEE